MARRRSRGFGLTTTQHLAEVMRPLRSAARSLANAKRALHEGDCWEAQDWYAAAAGAQAEATIHLLSAGPAGRVRPALQRSVELADKLVRERIYQKCGSRR